MKKKVQDYFSIVGTTYYNEVRWKELSNEKEQLLILKANFFEKYSSAEKNEGPLKNEFLRKIQKLFVLLQFNLP